MDDTHTTNLILDLRDRMARFETKLDGHFEAHVLIDKRFERIEARVEDQDVRINAAAAEIATNKTRYATLAAVASAILAILGVAGEHILKLLGLG